MGCVEIIRSLFFFKGKMRYSTDIRLYLEEYAQRGIAEPEGAKAWAMKTRTKERGDVFDNVTLGVRDLLLLMYGSRENFVNASSEKVHKYEVDLVNADRMSPYEEMMEAMANHFGIVPVSERIALDVMHFLSHAIRTERKSVA